MVRLSHLAVCGLLAVLACPSGLAVAQQRCEGTLCDLYYGGSAGAQPATTQPAAPTAVTVPTGNVFSNFFSRSDGAAAPVPAAAGTPAQREGMLHVGGGGLAGGNRASECGGTICDLMHGHAFEDDSAASLAQSTNGVPMSHYDTTTVAVRPAERVAPQAAAPATGAPEPRVAAVRVPPTPALCAAKGGDPWSCYRR